MPKLRPVLGWGTLGVLAAVTAFAQPVPAQKPPLPTLTLSSDRDPGWCGTFLGPTSLECLGPGAEVIATIGGETEVAKPVLCVDGFELRTAEWQVSHGVNRYRFLLARPPRLGANTRALNGERVSLGRRGQAIDGGSGHRAYLASKGECGAPAGRKTSFFEVAVAATPGLSARGAGALFAVLVFLLALLVRAFPALLKDAPSADPNPPAAPRPWSLARVQLAWWTAIVFGAWVVIFLVTHNYQSLTPQALTLLGVSVATTTAGAAEQARKERLKAEAKAVKVGGPPKTLSPNANLEEVTLWVTQTRRVAALEATAPISQPHSSFFTDILTDENGASLPRLQAVIWTIVLGALFVWRVFANMAMPTFSTELLFLAGISSGTYLFGKFAERRV